MISVLMMKQKNVIEQLRFAYDFLIAVFFFPMNGRGPSLKSPSSEFLISNWGLLQNFVFEIFKWAVFEWQ